MRRVLRIIAGCALLVVGLLGLVLPVLQGWLFLGAGLLVLFPEETRMGRRIRAWMKARKGDVKDRLHAWKARRRGDS